MFQTIYVEQEWNTKTNRPYFRRWDTKAPIGETWQDVQKWAQRRLVRVERFGLDATPPAPPFKPFNCVYCHSPRVRGRATCPRCGAAY